MVHRNLLLHPDEVQLEQTEGHDQTEDAQVDLGPWITVPTILKVVVVIQTTPVLLF